MSVVKQPPRPGIEPSSSGYRSDVLPLNYWGAKSVIQYGYGLTASIYAMCCLRHVYKYVVRTQTAVPQLFILYTHNRNQLLS